MKKIFDRNWVDTHISDYYSLTDSGRNRLAAEMQTVVESRFPDYDALAANHDADQAVIEVLTGDLIKLKIELVKLKAEMQVMSAIGSEEHYADHIKQMHDIQPEQNTTGEDER
jgi:DNA-binding PadR family transcriptional regulator